MTLQIRKNSFLRSVVTLTSGTVLAQLVTIAASPVITRLYSPADMGLISSFTAITSILGIIAAGAYENAVILPNNEIDAKALVFLGGMISVAFGLAVTVFFILLNDPLISILKLQSIPRAWFYGIGFVITVTGFDAMLNRLVIRQKRFKTLAGTAVSQQAATNGIKIGTGFGGFGASGLFFATIFGQLVRLVCLFIAERKYFFGNKEIPDVNRIKSIALRYKKFPLVTAWSSLLNSASTQVPVVMFTSFFSAEVAGYYSLTYRILSLPMSLVGSSVGQVFIERAAKARNNSDELKRITVEIYKKLLLVGSVIMSFVVFYGDILFPFVFGNNWLMAGKYSQWISIWLVFVLAVSPLSSIYTILERQGESLLMNIIMFVSRTGVIIIAYMTHISDIDLIAIFSVVGAVLWISMCFRILHLVNSSFYEIVKSSLLVMVPIFGFQFLISSFIRRIFL